MERQLRPDLHAAGRLEAAITPDSPRQVIDVELFSSSLLRVGRWRCPAGHQQFRDSGPASDTFIAFPRESVRIQHEGDTVFVADANTVTYYNKGQRYWRTGAAGWGDRCEWFAFEPAVVAEAMTDHDPAARDRLDRVFPFTHGAADAVSYLDQRRVFAHVSREKAPDRLFVEETMLGVLSRVSLMAYGRANPRSRRPPTRADRDIVEDARQLMARHYRHNTSLSVIAKSLGSSVFHLSRSFRRRTGFSLHQYRNQLRLRVALEQLPSSRGDLSGLALSLGFSSHSHFTDAFRRTFGRTPSSSC